MGWAVRAGRAGTVPGVIEKLEIPTADGTADAELAHSGQRRPGVLFFPDAFGLRPQITAMIERLAGYGYTVLAPNMFYRAGRAPIWDIPDLSVPETRKAFMEQIQPVRNQLTPERTLADIGSYLDFLHNHPATAAGRVGVTGYCMGGRNALRAAGTFGDQIGAVGAFHAGRLTGDEPDAPIHVVDGIRGEVLLGYADNDASATPEQIQAFDDALRAAGVRFTSSVYPDAPHGYTMADTAMYQKEGEERHWRELKDLLQRAL